MSAICGASARAQTREKFDKLGSDLKAVKSLASEIAEKAGRMANELCRAGELLIDITSVDNSYDFQWLTLRTARMIGQLKKLEVSFYNEETSKIVDKALSKLP